jgi:hypothetical protein
MMRMREKIRTSVGRLVETGIEVSASIGTLVSFLLPRFVL